LECNYSASNDVGRRDAKEGIPFHRESVRPIVLS
jgi:hypothetical protein